jgi:hypothetical protein
MNRIIENVERILESLGDKIKTDKQLLLIYWKDIDGVKMNKEVISTNDFLQKTTNPCDIINAKYMLEQMKENEK